MASSSRPRKNKRGKANYLYSIVGVALVLFLLGILGLIVLYASRLADTFKDDIEVEIIFNDATREEKALQLEKIIAKQAFTRESEYISKEKAAEIYKKQFKQEESFEVLGFNPLYASINLKLNTDYVNTDSLVKIKRFIEQSNIVREVNYHKNLVDAMVSNMQKISLILLGISLLLIIAVVILIDNTIRLAMFSNRFLIKTMQMVGATRKFIAKPFIKRSVINGIISGAMAALSIFLLYRFTQSWYPEMKSIQIGAEIMFLCIGILLLGVLISYISTSRSVVKYLKTQLDDLY
jgi:cell division transport system permease protein